MYKELSKEYWTQKNIEFIGFLCDAILSLNWKHIRMFASNFKQLF